MKLLLALSGGGFRATIFHLGVIRYFRDFGLLQMVDTMSSVSGGSILAAHVALNWNGYTGPINEFFRQQDRIKALTKHGLRNRLLRREPFYLLSNALRRRKYTITDRLRDYYEEIVFVPDDRLATLREARERHNAPNLFLMTTTLTQPTAVCFFSPGAFVLQDRDKPPHKLDLDGYSVAAAVAASSAFPQHFPPVRFSAVDCGLSQEQFGLATQYLTDGGVFENLGVTMLRDYASETFPAPAKAGKDYLIVVSNAGAKIDWDYQTIYTQRRIRSMLRSVEIVQYWAEERLRLDRGPKELSIDIDDFLDPTVSPGVPDREVQKQASRLRTDLDVFSDLEWRVLYDHGYSIAGKVMQPIVEQFADGEDQLPAESHHHPWQDIVAATGAWKRLQKPLEAGQRRRWRPWLALDWFSAPYFALLLLLVILLGILLWPRRKPTPELPASEPSNVTNGRNGSRDIPTPIQGSQLDGVWESRSSIDPQLNGRFKLAINKESCAWTEYGKSGQLTVDTSVGKRDGKLYIERPNDIRVLAFLFRPKVAEKVLERKPSPSYLLLRQEGNKLVGTWTGLQVMTAGTDEIKGMGPITKDCEFIKVGHR